MICVRAVEGLHMPVRHGRTAVQAETTVLYMRTGSRHSAGTHVAPLRPSCAGSLGTITVSAASRHLQHL